MTHLRKMMLEELQRRNYSQKTTKAYLHTVWECAKGARLKSEETVGFFFVAKSVRMYYARKGGPHDDASRSLESLEQQRANIANQIAALGDLRCGSITSTAGRCGNPNAIATFPMIRGTVRIPA